VSYTMTTRRKIERFIDSSNESFSRGQIQCLGGDHPVVRWDSLNAVLEDLVLEGRVVQVQKMVGKQVFVCFSSKCKRI
jgi:hypothetical protein